MSMWASGTVAITICYFASEISENDTTSSLCRYYLARQNGKILASRQGNYGMTSVSTIGNSRIFSHSVSLDACKKKFSFSYTHVCGVFHLIEIKLTVDWRLTSYTQIHTTTYNLIFKHCGWSQKIFYFWNYYYVFSILRMRDGKTYV